MYNSIMINKCFTSWLTKVSLLVHNIRGLHLALPAGKHLSHTGSIDPYIAQIWLCCGWKSCDLDLNGKV